MKLDNMGIEFNFNDILWEVYKDVNDIKTQYDLNYILAFVFKENIISVVDDLLDECVGKRFIDFVGMPKNIKEKNIKDYEVESGDYLVFSKKIYITKKISSGFSPMIFDKIYDLELVYNELIKHGFVCEIQYF